VQILGRIVLAAAVFLPAGFFTAGLTNNLGFGLLMASFTTSMAIVAAMRRSRAVASGRSG
jgi:hypothetical protein